MQRRHPLHNYARDYRYKDALSDACSSRYSDKAENWNLGFLYGLQKEGLRLLPQNCCILLRPEEKHAAPWFAPVPSPDMEGRYLENCFVIWTTDTSYEININVDDIFPELRIHYVANHPRFKLGRNLWDYT